MENQIVQNVTDALQGIATSITDVLGAIAPLAIGVVGVFLVWRYGMRFFKSISK